MPLCQGFSHSIFVFFEKNKNRMTKPLTKSEGSVTLRIANCVYLHIINNYTFGTHIVNKFNRKAVLHADLKKIDDEKKSSEVVQKNASRQA